MSDERKHSWQDSFFKVVVGLCIGFGASQLTIVGQVSENTRDIIHLDKKVVETEARNEKRIEYIKDMLETSIKQNSDFLSAVREQNALINKLLKP